MGLKAILDRETILIDTIPKDNLRLASRSGDLSCHFCNDRIIYRHGEVRVAHFAHYNENPDCKLSSESQEHLKSKKFIYDSVPLGNPGLTMKDIEHIVGDRIYDVYFERANDKFAIELQHTIVSAASIEDKLKSATDNNIHTMYILIPGKGYLNIEEGIKPPRMIVKDSEKYLHKKHYGRIYLTDAEQIITCHLSQATTFVESREWYDSSGNQYSGGGYEKNLKSRRHFEGQIVYKPGIGPNIMQLKKNINDDLLIANFNDATFWKKK